MESGIYVLVVASWRGKDFRTRDRGGKKWFYYRYQKLKDEEGLSEESDKSCVVSLSEEILYSIVLRRPKFGEVTEE